MAILTKAQVKRGSRILMHGYEWIVQEVNEWGCVARGIDGQGDIQVFDTEYHLFTFAP